MLKHFSQFQVNLPDTGYGPFLSSYDLFQCFLIKCFNHIVAYIVIYE